MCDADLRTTRGSLPVALPPGQLRPYYARVLVSYRHRGNVGAALRPESIGPNAGRIPPAVEVAHRGARSLDQQRSQVVIAALGDREHDRAPTTRRRNIQVFSRFSPFCPSHNSAKDEAAK